MYDLDQIHVKHARAAARRRTEALNAEIPRAVILSGQVSREMIIAVVLDGIREVVTSEREDLMLATFPTNEGRRADLYVAQLLAYARVLKALLADPGEAQNGMAIALEFAEWAKHATSPKMRSVLANLVSES